MASNTGFFKGSNDTFEIGLNIYQIGVYTYLTRCANNNKSAFPSYATIAEKCGISKPKAISTVAELEELGLIKKQIRLGEGRNNSNSYKVIFAQKGKHGLPLKVNDVYHGSKQDLPYKELNNKELREEELYNTSNLHSTALFLKEYASNIKGYIEDTLTTYYATYKEHKGKEHSKIKKNQLQRVYQFLEEAIYAYGDLDDIIEEYFNTVKKVDHNINHFCTDGIVSTLAERLK